jgi:hypothetical protein
VEPVEGVEPVEDVGPVEGVVPVEGVEPVEDVEPVDVDGLVVVEVFEVPDVVGAVGVAVEFVVVEVALDVDAGVAVLSEPVAAIELASAALTPVVEELAASAESLPPPPPQEASINVVIPARDRTRNERRADFDLIMEVPRLDIGDLINLKSH